MLADATELTHAVAVGGQLALAKLQVEGGSAQGSERIERARAEVNRFHDQITQTLLGLAI